MPDLIERILLLKETSVFSQVDTENLRWVAHELEEVRFAAGQRIFEIEDPSDQFYVVVSGRIGISTQTDPNDERYVTILGPGSSLGEMGCFDDLPRSATAHVLEDAELLALQKTKLRLLVEQYPELAHGLLRGLGARLRSATRAPEQEK